MEQTALRSAAEPAADTTQSEGQTGVVQVTIKDAFVLGLCFGLGFGAAMCLYALFALVVAKEFLQAGLR